MRSSGSRFPTRPVEGLTHRAIATLSIVSPVAGYVETRHSRGGQLHRARVGPSGTTSGLSQPYVLPAATDCARDTYFGLEPILPCERVRSAGYAFPVGSLNTAREEQLRGLWRNCEDSIVHALEHFSAASQEEDSFHHRKWAILSVAHAAEVYCNLLLSAFDPAHPNHPKGHYPALDRARQLLRNHPRLTSGEGRVIDELLEPLSGQRNILMHMPAPEMPSITDTAVAVLSLLHIIRRRTGLDTKEFFDQSPPIERDIFEQVGWKEHDAWFRVAESLVRDEYGEEHVDNCDNCGAGAVPPDSLCQACFSERSESPR